MTVKKGDFRPSQHALYLRKRTGPLKMSTKFKSAFFTQMADLKLSETFIYEVRWISIFECGPIWTKEPNGQKL